MRTFTFIGAVILFVLVLLAIFGWTNKNELDLVEWGALALSGGIILDAVFGGIPVRRTNP